MGADWPTVRLGDHVDSCLGKMLDKEKNRGELFPYLGNKNVRWGSFDTDDLAQMRFEEHEHDRYGLKYGDLVVCEGGEPGRCAIWKNEIPGMKIQKALHRIRVKEKLDNRFLHYWFLLSGRNGALEPYFTGTTIKHLTGKAIVELEIPLPPKAEQKAIAHILGTLDDKIELNRQMNATLEAMAQALFKSWFVDFDPVIDNALAAGNPIPEPLQVRAEARKALGDQRKPLPEAIQKQFPSRFVFNEDMGWVPEGWEARSIGDAFSLLGGHPFKSGEYVDDGQYGIVTIKNVQDASFIEECTNRITIIPEKMKEHCYLSAGDILLSLTGNVGRACIVSPGKYLLNQRVAKIVGNDSISNAFAYFFFRQRSIFEDMLTIAKGTAQQNLSPIETAKITRTMPRSCCIHAVQDYLERPFEKIISNTAQIQSLNRLRDTLLPKLLSGQLRIPDAEKQVAEAL